MYEIRFPLPGDILFFESSKIHGRAIVHTQRKMGLENHRYMHAALVVDGDLVVESTTRYGVRKIPLSALEDPSEYFDATVLRKPSHQSWSVDEAWDLADAAYYYFKEAYGWRGIVARQTEEEGKSICSVFVKKAVRRAELVPATAFAKYPDQIFPAQLFSALIEVGYRVLDGGYDFNSWKRPVSHSVDLIDIKERSRDQVAQINAFNYRLTRISQALEASLQKEFSQKPRELRAYVSAFTDRAFLDFIHDRFKAIAHHYNQIDQQIKTCPRSWRDSIDLQSLLLRMEATMEYYTNTMNFVAVFDEVLLQRGEPQQVVAGDLFAAVVVPLRNVFLVTGASSLDQLDAKIQEARAKLRVFQKSVRDCPAVTRLNFPRLDDECESSIATLETFSTQFRKSECALGKSAMDRLVAYALTEAQRFMAGGASPAAA